MDPDGGTHPTLTGAVPFTGVGGWYVTAVGPSLGDVVETSAGHVRLGPMPGSGTGVGPGLDEQPAAARDTTAAARPTWRSKRRIVQKARREPIEVIG